MQFDFYLSEMSVSDYHGGGLTLQRVVGEDLKNIDHLIYISRFGTDIETIPTLKRKVLDLSSPWDSDFARQIIGRTYANAISNKLSVIKYDAQAAARAIKKKINKQGELKGFICPQGAKSIYTLEALKKRSPVNYVTWIMDDHLISYKNGRWIYPPGIEKVFANHLQQAAKVFVISPVMQQFYQDRFGVESTVLFGSADVSKHYDNAAEAKSAIKIGYFGAVTAWQTDALKALADALHNTNTELHIYSAASQLPDSLKVNNVSFKGRLDQNDVLKTMSNYNALVLPISFDNKMRSMSQFNIATKMSEYLASGVPILAIGPPYAAMIEYLDSHKAAILIKSIDKAEINTALAQLNDDDLVKSTLQNAKNRTLLETGTEPMRQRWQNS